MDQQTRMQQEPRAQAPEESHLDEIRHAVESLCARFDDATSCTA